MRFFAVYAVVVGLAAGPASACCMVPAKYNGSIHQSSQEAVLFYDRGIEDLILKINYHISGRSMPDRFAWVITVPNEPESYRVASPDLFRQMYDWAMPMARIPRLVSGTAGGMASAATKGLSFGARVQVGPYDIQPVRALGMGALQGLNHWLSAKGFPTENPGHMAYFVQNHFTFLCVKVNPPDRSGTVAPAAEVVPLHLRFRTRQPYYPLKFSSRQGVFNLNLYTLTRGSLDYGSSMDSLQRINWVQGRYWPNLSVRATSFPSALQSAIAGNPRRFAGGWTLNVLSTSAVNSVRPIRDWKRDIFLAVRPARGVHIGMLAR